MAMRMIAVSEGDPKTHFIIGDGDPKKDPMMLAQVAVKGMGLSPAVPLQQHFKFGTWEEPTAEDKKLLPELVKLPPMKY